MCYRHPYKAYSRWLLIAIVPFCLRGDETSESASRRKTLIEATIPPDQLKALQEGTLSDLDRAAIFNPASIVGWTRQKTKHTASDAADAIAKDMAPAGTSTNGVGSLNSTANASTFSLLGLSVEKGSLTQSSQATAATVSTNLYKLFCESVFKPATDARKADDWKDLCYTGNNPLKNLTFGVTLKTDDELTLIRPRPLEAVSAATAKWEIFSKRDPRSLLKGKSFTDLEKLLLDAGNAALEFDKAFGDNCLKEGTALSEKQIPGKTKATLEQIETLLDGLEKLYAGGGAASSCRTAASTERLVKAFSDHNAFIGSLQQQAERSWVLSAQYDFVRQELPSQQATGTPTDPPMGLAAITRTAPQAATTTLSATVLPSLSSFGMHWESGKYNRTKYKGSFVVTAFHRTPATAAQGAGLRDFRLTNELEFQVVKKSGAKLDGTKFSLAAIYLDLRRPALGQKVQLFGKDVGDPGKIFVAQGKVTIPTGASGVKVPISISYSNRTELLPDPEWRAGIGFTFNWKAIF